MIQKPDWGRRLRGEGELDFLKRLSYLLKTNLWDWDYQRNQRGKMLAIQRKIDFAS